MSHQHTPLYLENEIGNFFSHQVQTTADELLLSVESYLFTKSGVKKEIEHIIAGNVHRRLLNSFDGNFISVTLYNDRFEKKARTGFC